MKKLAERIIQLRILIIAAFLGITIIFACLIPKTEIDPDMKNQLPDNMVSRINTNVIEELFGGTEMLMVLLRTDDVLRPETLRRVKNISKQMKKIKGVDKVLSLFDLKSIKGEDGMMIVEPAIRLIPGNEPQKELLRNLITQNDIVYGSVVSKDFTTTAVIAVLKEDVTDAYMVAEIEKIVQDNPGEEEIFIGGLPYTRSNIGTSIPSDIRRLLPIGLAVMLFFLYVCFRQLAGVFLPFLVVVMSIIFSMGIIPLLGWKIQIITIILPVILVAVANDYGIHMIAKYQEYDVSEGDRTNKELAKKIFSSLGKPVFLTGLTTIAGMLCLLGHLLVPARQLGILAAVGIAFALCASLFFIPSILSFLPRSKQIPWSDENKRKRPFLDRLLWFFGDFVSNNPKAVIILAVVFSVFASVGMFFVAIDADPNNYYPKDHPVVHAARLIDQKLGGSQNISIVFHGDIKDPRIMKKIDSMERTIENYPEVGNTTSIARVIRQMSRALNDEGEKRYDTIPNTRNAIAQYFELYTMSGEVEDFEKMVDFPYEHAMITARINTTSTPKLNRVVKRIENMIEHEKDVLLVGGYGVVFSDLSKLVVKGQLLSLGMATVIVAILLMVLFRSVCAGFISAIPLGLSIIVLFGLMGLLDIELNLATALLSSIMIGVGIDYTIHFLWRYREERRAGLNPVDGVKKTLTTTGRGIVFNAFSVIIGFIVLLISSFMPVKFFGFLVVISIFACLVGALVLVPALCLVLKPQFLEPQT